MVDAMVEEMRKVARGRKRALNEAEALARTLEALVVAGHERGMSERQLAGAAGVTRRTVRRWVGME